MGVGVLSPPVTTTERRAQAARARRTDDVHRDRRWFFIIMAPFCALLFSASVPSLLSVGADDAFFAKHEQEEVGYGCVRQGTLRE